MPRAKQAEAEAILETHEGDTPAPTPPSPISVDEQADGDADQNDDGSETTPPSPEEVRLGHVTGVHHRLPLDEVLALVEPFHAKLEVLQSTASVQGLLSRVRATEGRCAPIYFTGDDDGEPEHLFAGDDALSAAKAAGIETVSVIVIRAGDAGALQSYLAEQANRAQASTSEEDDFLMLVNAHHQEPPSASPA